MEDVKINALAGVSTVNTDIESLIRDSERLQVARDYVASATYIDRSTMIAILGEPKNNKDN